MKLAALSVTLAVSLMTITAASAVTYEIKISDGAYQAEDLVGTPFTPEFGYLGGPEQSWGFGVNEVKGGGWLDFAPGGTYLQAEGGAGGNIYFSTSTAFYSITGSGANTVLSFGAPGVYQIAGSDGGTVTLGVPEASTWAMLVLGFAGLGAMGFGRKRNDRALSATA